MEASIFPSEVAKYRASCGEGTFSLEPCPTDYREKCVTERLTSYTYHSCELTDVMRGIDEGACASQGGEWITK
jgi:hypothetical protein